MKITTRRKAFTLVELIVTCVILGILFIVLLANIDFSTDTAREAGLESTLKSYEHACISVGMEYGGFTNDPNELVKQLNKRLDSEMHLKASAGKIYTDYVDPWGNTFEIVYTEPINAIGEIRFTSAGPDGIANTADDYILVTRYDTAKAEVIVERPVNDPEHMHIFDQKIASGQYIAAPATCIAPRQYFYSCACGVAGNLAFPDGDVDPNAHSISRQQYVSFDKNQHKLQNWCRDCNEMISELFENHSLTADGNQCQYCWIEGGVHEHTYNLSATTDRYKKSSATCTEPAYYYYSCSCGDRGTEVFAYGSALGHNEISVGTAAIHSKCYTCGVVLQDASGHMLRETVMITATCALPGQMQVDCFCGYTYVKEIPAVGHVSTGQLSCKADVVCQVCGALLQAKEQHKPIDGGTYGIHKQCQVCGDVLQGFEHHQYVTQVMNGTCNSLGYTKKICACGYSYNETQEMEYDYTRHGEGAYELLANTNPNGTNEYHTICSICGRAWTKNGLPTEHKLIIDQSASYDATCVATGRTVEICTESLNGKQCTYTKVSIIDQKSHTTIRHAAVAEKCLTAGQEVYYSCNTCTKFFSDKNATDEIAKDSWIIPATGHTEVTLAAKEATCTATGLKAGKKCSKCNVVTVPQETIAALGHSTQNGSACSSGKCVRCGTLLTGNGSHNYTYASTSDACGRCQNCGQTTNHTLSWQELTETRTCLQKGTSRYTCTNTSCNYTFDHVYNSDTCADNCSLCKTSVKAPNKHESPNTAPGGTLNNHEYYPCCGKVVSTTHSNTTHLSFVVGNCVDPSVTYYQCSCGYQQNADDNTGIKGATVPGNHKSSTPGYELDMNVCLYCTSCETIIDQEHSYIAGVFTVIAPQCTNPGTKGQRCEECKYLNEWPNTDWYDFQDPQYHTGQRVYGNTVGLTGTHTVYSCCRTMTTDQHTYVLDSYSTENCNSTLQLYAMVKCSDSKCNYKMKVSTREVTVSENQAANCQYSAMGSYLIAWATDETTQHIAFKTSLCKNSCLHLSNGSLDPYNHYQGGGTIQYGPTAVLKEAHMRCEHCKGMINSDHNLSPTTIWSCDGARDGATLSFKLTCTTPNCNYTKIVTAGSVDTPASIVNPGCERTGSTRHSYKLTSPIKYEYVKNDGTTATKDVVQSNTYVCEPGHALDMLGHDWVEIEDWYAANQQDCEEYGYVCGDLIYITIVCSRGSLCCYDGRLDLWDMDILDYFDLYKETSSPTTSSTCQIGAANFITAYYTLFENPDITLTIECECKDVPSNCLHRFSPNAACVYAALTSGGNAEVHARCIWTSQGCKKYNSNHVYTSSSVTFKCTTSVAIDTEPTGVVCNFNQTCGCGYTKTTTETTTCSTAETSTTCTNPISYTHSYNGKTCAGHKFYGTHTAGGWTYISGSQKATHNACGQSCPHRKWTTQYGGRQKYCNTCGLIVILSSGGTIGGGGLQEDLA